MACFVSFTGSEEKMLLSFAYLPEVTHFFAGASGRSLLVEDVSLAVLVLFFGCFSTFVSINTVVT